MTLSHVSLGQPEYIPINYSAMLINPDGFKTFIKEIIIHNTITTPETVEVLEVNASAGGLGNPSVNRRLLKIQIEPDDTIFVAFSDVLILDSEYDAIFCKCTTANAVNIKFTGDLEDV